MMKKVIFLFCILLISFLPFLPIQNAKAQVYEDFSTYNEKGDVHNNHIDFWNTMNPYIFWDLYANNVSQPLDVSKDYFSYGKICKYTISFNASVSANYTLVFSIELEFEEIEIEVNKIKLKYKDNDFEFESEFNWVDMFNMTEFDFSFSYTTNETGFYFYASDFILEGTNVFIDPAYEDFTTYTEVDPLNHIDLVGTNHIDFDARRNEDAYLYKDYGVNYFKSFTHLIDVKSVSLTTSDLGVTWMLSNNLDDLYGLRINSKTAISVLFYDSSGSKRLYLEEEYGGSAYNDYYVITDGAWYYLTITKTGTALTAEIYSDSARTTLLDTLSLTLQANHEFRYVFGCNTFNTGSADVTDLEIENLALALLDFTITFYNNIGGILRVNNGTITNGTANIYGEGSILELVGIVEGNRTYGFNNFTYLATYNVSNPYNLTVTSNMTVWAYFEAITVGGGFSVGIGAGLVLGLSFMIIIFVVALKKKRG